MRQAPVPGRLGRIALAGAIVAATVGSLAAVWGSGSCGRGPGRLAGDCRGLVRTLSIRMGIAAGIATVVMVLMVAGLGRMVEQGERDRLARLESEGS
jgi:hypothetical protein